MTASEKCGSVRWRREEENDCFKSPEDSSRGVTCKKTAPRFVSICLKLNEVERCPQRVLQEKRICRNPSKRSEKLAIVSNETVSTYLPNRFMAKGK